MLHESLSGKMLGSLESSRLKLIWDQIYPYKLSKALHAFHLYGFMLLIFYLFNKNFGVLMVSADYNACSFSLILGLGLELIPLLHLLCFWHSGMPVRAINRPGSQLLGANGRDDGPIVSVWPIYASRSLSIVIIFCMSSCLLCWWTCLQF